MNEAPKTVKDILTSGTEYLQSKQVENAALICEMLLSRLLGCPRLELSLNYSTKLSEKKVEAMRRGIRRAAQHEPVQYILGEAGFMNHTFKCDKRALIPRPETELLVTMMLDTPSIWQNDSPRIVDVGTGSGCIALSLAAARPKAKVLAIDISDNAIALAKENASKLGLSERTIFVNADLADIVEPESIDAIAANLPYIASETCDTLPLCVREYEPRSALDGGPDGLDVIRSVVADAAFILKSGARIFLEIGESQGRATCDLLQSEGFSEIKVTQDLNGRDRVVSGVLNI
jgi:release factor glutamine methyltransferase